MRQIMNQISSSYLPLNMTILSSKSFFFCATSKTIYKKLFPFSIHKLAQYKILYFLSFIFLKKEEIRRRRRKNTYWINYDVWWSLSSHLMLRRSYHSYLSQHSELSVSSGVSLSAGGSWHLHELWIQSWSFVEHWISLLSTYARPGRRFWNAWSLGWCGGPEGSTISGRRCELSKEVLWRLWPAVWWARRLAQVLELRGACGRCCLIFLEVTCRRGKGRCTRWRYFPRSRRVGSMWSGSWLKRSVHSLPRRCKWTLRFPLHSCLLFGHWNRKIGHGRCQGWGRRWLWMRRLHYYPSIWGFCTSRRTGSWGLAGTMQGTIQRAKEKLKIRSRVLGLVGEI